MTRSVIVIIAIIKVILIIAMIIAIFVLMVAVDAAEGRAEIENWNNGICSSCGGQSRFSSAAYTRYSRRYYYTCTDCGHTIETYELMK